MFISKSFNVIRKLISGEEIISLKRDQSHWDRQFSKGGWGFLLTRPQYNVSLISDWLNTMASEDKTVRVLDVGCGNGALARKLNLSKIQYTGTDISEVALAQAKENVPSGTFIHRSMEAEPGQNEKYDVVVFCEILLYGDYEKTLKQHQTLLNEGGVVIVSLYDSWRTKYIWWKIKKYLKIIESAHLKDKVNNSGWRVWLATYSGTGE